MNLTLGYEYSVHIAVVFGPPNIDLYECSVGVVLPDYHMYFGYDRNRRTAVT